VDPDGPIGSYTWQVSNTSTFATIVASGFTNDPGDPSIPTRTQDTLSGLPNGTYFWRVMDIQIVGGAVFSLQSPSPPVRGFPPPPPCAPPRAGAPSPPPPAPRSSTCASSS